mmetsp:Transcript_66545/g.118144  ORF Transcript_66545/g.118144 Transcript_66545/m.118144 type:complete len:205 (-) Transcript_66545:118-732(-)
MRTVMDAYSDRLSFMRAFSAAMLAPSISLSTRMSMLVIVRSTGSHSLRNVTTLVHSSGEYGSWEAYSLSVSSRTCVRAVAMQRSSRYFMYPRISRIWSMASGESAMSFSWRPRSKMVRDWLAMASPMLSCPPCSSRWNTVKVLSTTRVSRTCRRLARHDVTSSIDVGVPLRLKLPCEAWMSRCKCFWLGASGVCAVVFNTARVR